MIALALGCGEDGDDRLDGGESGMDARGDGGLIESSDECDVVGHRGDSFSHPEDTLVAIESAFQHGAKLVEIDISPTADDEVVLMDDAELDRTTSGSSFVADMTLPDLRGLDAGSWRAPQLVGEPGPTLTETLMFAEQCDRQIYLDIKASGMAVDGGRGRGRARLDRDRPTRGAPRPRL